MTPMRSQIKLRVTDMHTGAEPVRIVTGGYPSLTGDTILAKRRDAQGNHDHLRALLMREPRGHAEMYGVIPTEPCHPKAAIGVLFMHNGGYSTMCGHETLALGRYVLDQGIVEPREPETRFLLDCPCGLVEVRVEVENDQPGPVSFESVAGYLHDEQLGIETRLSGRVRVDIAYGGAYYAIVSAEQLGLNIRESGLAELKSRALDITGSLREQHDVKHPTEPDLGFVYGTIITEAEQIGLDEVNHHLCWFGEGQLDRSPTGSGVTARLAASFAKGELEMGAEARFAGISGDVFRGKLSRPGTVADKKAVHTLVSGRAWYSGKSEFILEPGDPLGDGYLDPPTPGEAWRH